MQNVVRLKACQALLHFYNHRHKWRLVGLVFLAQLKANASHSCEQSCLNRPTPTHLGPLFSSPPLLLTQEPHQSTFLCLSPAHPPAAPACSVLLDPPAAPTPPVLHPFPEASFCAIRRQSQQDFP